MRFAVFAVLLTTVACASRSSTEGQATYVQPPDAGGEPVEPQEKSDDLKVTIVLDATGSFAAVDSLLCQLTSGAMTTTVASSGNVSGGGYSSSFDATATGSSSSSPVCGPLKDVKVTSLTSVTVNGSLPTTDKNCSGYCEAKADQTCATSADKVTCTTNAKASCSTDCKAKSKITGSGHASASALTQANGGLDASGNTTTKVDLVFDRVE